MPTFISRLAAIGSVLLVLCLTAALVFWALYGRGTPYPSIATPPALAAGQVSAPIQLPYPPGMVASAPDGRLFFTYHMLHQPERFVGATVFEWADGKAVPVGSAALQRRFEGAMGITVDPQNRLWLVKPGALAGRPSELLALDLTTHELVIDHQFAEGEAGFAQDLRVSTDGDTVYLADTGLFRFTEANLIVFDVPSKQARTLLRNHPTISAQDWVIRKTNGADYTLALGLLNFVVGLDGIALSADDQWLYLAAMSHDSVYRIATNALRNPQLSDSQLAAQLEFVGHKPMSDGISLLPDGRLIITDVENGGLGLLDAAGRYTTLSEQAHIDWADSVTVTPDGAVYFTDSRLTALIDQFARPSDQHTLLDQGPYFIYKIDADNINANKIDAKDPSSLRSPK